METIELAPGAVATVAHEPVELAPTISLGHRSVQARAASSDDYDAYLARTTGCRSWLWRVSDELRFDRESGRTVGLLFRIPEEPAEVQVQVAPHRNARPHYVGAEFSREPGDRYMYEVRQGRLTVLYPNVNLANEVLRSYALAEDLALLVKDVTAVGWRLENAERYIGENGRDADTLRHAYGKWLELSGSHNLELIEEHDDRALRELFEFHRLASEQGLRTFATAARALLSSVGAGDSV